MRFSPFASLIVPFNGIVNDTSNRYITFYLDDSSKLLCQYSSIPSNPFHLALVRKNNVLRIAVNGTFHSSTFSSSMQFLSSKYIDIGYEASTLRQKYFLGSLDDVCVIKGIALWTSNFTPPMTYLPDYKYL